MKIEDIIKALFSRENLCRLSEIIAGALIALTIQHIYYVRSGNDLTGQIKRLRAQMDSLIDQKGRELGVRMDSVIAQKTGELGIQMDKLTAQAKDINRSLNFTFIGLKNKGLIEGSVDKNGRPEGLNVTLPSAQIRTKANPPQVNGQEAPSPETTK